MSKIMELVQRVSQSTVSAWWRDNGVAFTWAVVTNGNPLRIRPTGQSDEVASSPESLIGPLAVGDRVLASRFGSAFVVVGRADRGAFNSVQTLSGVDLNSVMTPGDYFFDNTCTNQPYYNGDGSGNYGYVEVRADITDVFQRVTLATGIESAQYTRRYSKINTVWSGWKGARGGLQFLASWGSWAGSGAWQPFISFPSTPNGSWGDVSWRQQPTNMSALWLGPGEYRIGGEWQISRSGDGASITGAGTRIITAASGAWCRPTILQLPNPTNRVPVVIECNTMNYGNINTDYTLAAVYTNTSASCILTVERIGDVV